jgi:hypothetical protein
MIINLVWANNALAAPQTFREGMQTAAKTLQAAFLDKIIINISVSYGTFGNLPLPDQNTSEGDIGFTGNHTEGFGIVESYSNLRSLLANHATSGDAAGAQSVASLPNTSALEGHSGFVISTAQAKALGVLEANGAAIDGQVGMGTNFTGSVLISGALHELTHAMGRIAGLSLDLFRFNSDGSGRHVFGAANPAPAAYFSIDGGKTDLADFGINSDPGDFLNPPSSTKTPNDPFNETVGTLGSLSPEDLQLMDVLGFDLACFMSGTMISTYSKEAAVETLHPGDLVLTIDGRAVPVRWIGRQTVSMIFADPLRALPIRIKAGALADNVPLRDLRVSPDHAILLGDVLVQAGALVNGISIVRDTKVPMTFTYYHVEVDDHSLILAENTPTETFIDNLDRLAFDNWQEHEALYPGGKAIIEMLYPRAKAYRQVPRSVRKRLADRAERFYGARVKNDA